MTALTNTTTTSQQQQQQQPTTQQQQQTMPSNPQAAATLITTSTSLQQFDVIRKWLAKNQKKYFDNDQANNKQLSHFLGQFIQFQEDNLGRNAPKPLPNVTRLPVRVEILSFKPFRLILKIYLYNVVFKFEILVDFQQGGALCHLFSVVFKYKHEQKM